MNTNKLGTKLFLYIFPIILVACTSATMGANQQNTETTTPTTEATIPDPRCQFGELPNNYTFIDPKDDSGDWQFSEPAKQSMNTELLAEGVETLKEFPALYSLLIIRNNQIIIEEYFNDQTRNSSHEIASASKSILSMLVGIALENDFLSSTAQSLEEVLPIDFEEISYAERAQLTLSDLMTMRTGFAWEPSINNGKSRKWSVSIEKILDTYSRQTEPYNFIYNTGATHLMSSVLSAVSDKSTCDFAYEYLFDPLDITVEWWNQDDDGVFTGGWNMYMTPRELAKFGLLYLNKGSIQGQQIVSESWVNESLTPHISVDDGSGDFYGYWWWLSSIDEHDVYSARGGGGQMIYIVPEVDLIFVTTSDAMYQGYFDQFDSLAFLRKHILSAITDD